MIKTKKKKDNLNQTDKFPSFSIIMIVKTARYPPNFQRQRLSEQDITKENC